MIVADPTAFAVTKPLALTVAMVVLSLDHVTTRPPSGLPFASFGVAVSCTVWPVSTLAAAGVRLTEATGAGGHATVIVAVSVKSPGWLLATSLEGPQPPLW